MAGGRDFLKDCYQPGGRHELGLSDSVFIRFGYWDSLKKGLLAGERLGHGLKRMEAAYLEQNWLDDGLLVQRVRSDQHERACPAITSI